MRLKYQMRGLGIGIIVTALLMGVVKGEKVPLSDAEIKVRALELGMVESGSRRLSDITNPGQETDAPSSTGNGGESDGSPAAPEGENPPGAGSFADGSQEGSPEESGAEGEGTDSSAAGSGASGEGGAPAGAGDEQPSEAREGDTVAVVIESGTPCSAICGNLAELGLVEDASAFNDYLDEQGYTRRLRAGTFEISKGAGWEEIARVLMGGR